MLLGFTGTPRSGKTYSAIKEWYLTTLKDNVGNSEPRHIYTNINGILDESCLFATAEYTGLSVPEILDQVHIVGSGWFLSICTECPPHSLVIADEAHKFWCSREWKNFSEANRDYIAESGQHDVDIIWISQTSSSVEKWIVTRTEFIYSALNMQWIGLKNRFVLRQRDGLSQYSNMKPTFHRIESTIYNCYNSYQVKHRAFKNTQTSSLFGFGYKFMLGSVVLAFIYTLSLVFFPTEDDIAQANTPLTQDIKTSTKSKSILSVPNPLKTLSNFPDDEIKKPEFIKSWISGVFFVSGRPPVVYLKVEDGRIIDASRVQLKFQGNTKGKLLDSLGVAYEVGSFIEIKYSDYEHLSPVNHGTKSTAILFNGSLSNYSAPPLSARNWSFRNGLKKNRPDSFRHTSDGFVSN